MNLGGKRLKITTPIYYSSNEPPRFIFPSGENRKSGFKFRIRSLCVSECICVWYLFSTHRENAEFDIGKRIQERKNEWKKLRDSEWKSENEIKTWNEVEYFVSNIRQMCGSCQTDNIIVWNKNEHLFVPTLSFSRSISLSISNRPLVQKKKKKN